ncbi:MAG: ATP-binding protein [Rhodanobacteraceae bacterium]|jgi:predicted kinase|nr:ATP-binding protein [Rhodanobacteraceae bacterium]
MSKGAFHLVFGPQGAGKSTYSRQLSARVDGVLFSIDEWMGQLYGPDLPRPMDFGWVMERVRRCELRIGSTAAAIVATGGAVVLDLGFMKAKGRDEWQARAAAGGGRAQLHFVDAPYEIRRSRVLARNAERGETYSFEVTPPMFDFMERQFEPPTEAERAQSIIVDTR